MYEKPEEGEELEGDESFAGGDGEHATSADTGEVEDGSFENPEPQDDVQETSKPEVGDDFPNEGAYDSEAPTTESTATVAQTNLEDEQEAEESGNVSDNDQVSHGVHGGHDETQHATVHSEHHVAEVTAPGEYDKAQGTSAQDEYHVEEAAHGSPHGDHDVNHNKVHGEHRDVEDAAPHDEYHETDDYYEDYEAEPDVNAPEKLENNHASEPYKEEANFENDHEGNQSGEDQPDDALEDGELYVEEFDDEGDGASYDDSENKQDNASQGVSESRLRYGAEPADDLVGVSGDSDNPVKGTTPVLEEADDQVDSAAVGDEANRSQTVPEDPDDWNFDDEEYTDLGATDTFESGEADSLTEPHAHENVSTKRTREPEEEFELEGSPSPDTKRRRSS